MAKTYVQVVNDAGSVRTIDNDLLADFEANGWQVYTPPPPPSPSSSLDIPTFAKLAGHSYDDSHNPVGDLTPILLAAEARLDPEHTVYVIVPGATVLTQGQPYVVGGMALDVSFQGGSGIPYGITIEEQDSAGGNIGQHRYALTQVGAEPWKLVVMDGSGVEIAAATPCPYVIVHYLLAGIVKTS